jgi:G6PDH family F420-dependent oxidoreductase
MKIGYFLSCEEYGPHELVEQALLAQDAGFEALWISDHFHPWNDEQGQSPFVWSVIGALSQGCELPVTTAVTCPIMRVSPVVVAQAAATSAVMLKGGFRLGVGSGEALNEHIHGDPWPSAEMRLEMLEEAIEVMRALWRGDFVNHYGRHFTVDNARIYTRRSDEPPEIYMSAFGPKAVSLAARVADGYITTSADQELLGMFREESGGKPATVGFKVGFAQTEDEGVQHAHRLWANSGVPGEVAQVLPSPKHFEQVSALVTEDMTRSSVVCGREVRRHVAAFDPYLEAGFEEIYVANMGPHYKDMIATYGREVLPAVRERAARSASDRPGRG